MPNDDGVASDFVHNHGMSSLEKSTRIFGVGCSDPSALYLSLFFNVGEEFGLSGVEDWFDSVCCSCGDRILLDFSSLPRFFWFLPKCLSLPVITEDNRYSIVPV